MGMEGWGDDQEDVESGWTRIGDDSSVNYAKKKKNLFIM